MSLIDSLPAAPTGLSVEDENALIATAQQTVSFGASTVPTAAAQTAKETLLGLYAPLLAKTLSRSGAKDESAEDLEASLIECVLTTIATHDTSIGVRLAARLPLLLSDTVQKHSATREAFTVNSRERTRFFSLLYSADVDGDVDKALAKVEAANDGRMTPAKFKRMVATILNVDDGGLDTSIEDTDDAARGDRNFMTPLDAPGEPESFEERVEREIVVQHLLNLLTPRQRLVVMLFYGFTTENLTSIRLKNGYQWDEELTDGQIAALEEVSLRSRVTVNRERQAALAVMRADLGVADPA